MSATLVATVVSLAAGLSFIVLGASGSSRFRTAGRFDIAVGILLTVYGLLAVPLGLNEFDFIFPIAFLYLSVGLYLFRRYYLLAAESEQRQRDLLSASLLAIPGGLSMGGLLIETTDMVLIFVSFLPVSVAGVVLLLVDTIRVARGKQIYKRDIGAAMLMILLLALVALMMFLLIPRPAT